MSLKDGVAAEFDRLNGEIASLRYQLSVAQRAAAPALSNKMLKVGDAGWECCGDYNYNGDCCYRKMSAPPHSEPTTKDAL